MIIPEYWSEARVQHRKGNRQVTLRRWGWSLESEQDAARMAEQRVQEALALILQGKMIQRSEIKVPYNGADGYPIREEVISRQANSVITRNSYGALCLNTENVLISDIDLDEFQSSGFLVATFLSITAGFLFGYYLRSVLIGIGVFIGVLITGFVVQGIIDQNRKKQFEKSSEGRALSARQKILRFSEAHRDWGMRLYRTPNGFRVIATHRTFDPDAAEVQEFFNSTDVDPQYQFMCKNQKCFRARLTAKPWRIGMKDRMRPRPGVWPLSPDKLAIRNEWISRYEKKIVNFAACRFIETIGASTEDPTAAEVVQLHDEMCQAQRDLPIA
jgi:general stress protein CsbA